MRVRLYALLATVVLLACHSDDSVGPDPEPTIDQQLRASIGNWGVVPIGEMPPQNPAKVALGRALFFDKILSGNRDVACATCHDPAAALTDGRSLAIGTGGTGITTSRQLGEGRQFTARSAPTLLNAGLGFYQMFWDARLTGGFGQFFEGSRSFGPVLPNLLAAQAMLPVLNRLEMRGQAGDRDLHGDVNELALLGDDQEQEIWSAITERLLSVPAYVAMFNTAFPGQPPRFEHAAEALAVFQMEEFTFTRTPFDRYLEHDDKALTLQEKRGGLLFFGKALCSSCHNGPFLGANNLANVGAPQIGPGGTRQPPLDLGRGEEEGFEFYQFAFRVAPLRNVELTAPYFHSGAYQTLEAVVQHYNDPEKALREYDPSQLSADVRALYHGDEATVNAVLQTVDPRLRQGLNLTDGEIDDLVAFLKALTDPAARNLPLAVSR